MSFDRSPSRRTSKRAALAAVLALSLLPLGGCGRKEDPQPPPLKNPAKTTDLKVRQRGQSLYLTMSYPATTMGGLALPGIDRIEYVRYTRPAPEFMEVPQAEVEIEGDETESEEAKESEAREELMPGDTGEGSSSEDTEAAEVPVSETEADVVVEEMEGERADEPRTGDDQAETGEEDEAAGDAGASPAEMPEPNPFLQIRLDMDEFEKKAEEVLVLEGTELEGAVVGGQIVVSFPLEEIPTEPPVAYSFRVRTFTGRLKSPESNIASFVPLPPPPPPSAVTLTATASGVELDWKKPAGVAAKRTGGDGMAAEPALDPAAASAPGMRAPAESASESDAASTGESEDESSDAASESGESEPMEVVPPSSDEPAAERGSEAGDEPIEIEGWAVYRRLAESTLYPTTPLTTLPPDETSYLDRSAQFGSSYVYIVNTVRMRQPVVESEASEEVAIDYADDFAPAPPRGLVLLAEAGRIRLIWEANTESDVVGYLVFVREGEGDYQPLTPEPIAANEYLHSGTTSGVTYTYRVVAVDTADNESPPSREASTRAP